MKASYVVMSRHQVVKTITIVLANTIFENVAKFKCVETTATQKLQSLRN